MAFKMKGSAFKLGGVQGTDGHASALKQKQEQDSALQCRMYNKANQFKMKSPLEQSCPPGTEMVMVDENGNPLPMKSAFKQYDRDEKEGFTYDDEVVTMNEDGTTTYTKTGTKPGEYSGGKRSGDPVRSKLMSEAIARGDDTYEYNGRTYTTERGSSTPGETDEMSYTTKPKMEVLSLDPIPATLSQNVEPELAKSKFNQKQSDRFINRRRKKQDIKRKENKIIPRIGRSLGNMDLNPFDRKGWAGKTKRKKAMRKVGDFLNPFNDGKYVAPACRTT